MYAYRHESMKKRLYINIVIAGSLEVKLPTIWTDEKHSQEEAQAWNKSEGKDKRWRRSDMEKVRKDKSVRLHERTSKCIYRGL